MSSNFQRVGSLSNAHVGREFEEVARRYFLLAENLVLSPRYELLVGLASIKKPHRFDLGLQDPPVLVECKSMTWTAGGNSPSAKLKALREDMIYFHVAPTHYRKIMFMLRSSRESKTESLAQYFVRLNGHFIPPGVEIMEYDESSAQVSVVLSAQQ